jgi:hypothetical protein
MTAQIVIDGVPGSKENVSLGSTITLSNYDNSGVLGWTWQFTDIPSGSSAVIVDPNSAIATFVVDVAGTYLVRLLTYIDAAKNNLDDIDQKGAGVNLQPPLSSTWRIPAVNETIEFHGSRGWAQEVNAFLKLIARLLNIGNLDDIIYYPYGPQSWETVLIDSSEGAGPIFLPPITAANKGHRICIKDTVGEDDPLLGPVVVMPYVTNTVNNLATETLFGPGRTYESRWYQSDGISNWEVVAAYKSPEGGGGGGGTVLNRYTAKALFFLFKDMEWLTSFLGIDFGYSSGVLTAEDFGAFPDVDGVTINEGDDILIGMDITESYPVPSPVVGLYTLTTKGDGSTYAVLTRKAPFVHGFTLSRGNNGSIFYIEEGEIYAGKEISLWGEEGDVLGVDNSIGVIPETPIYADDTTDAFYPVYEGTDPNDRRSVSAYLYPNHTLEINMPGSRLDLFGTPFTDYNYIEFIVGYQFIGYGSWMAGAQCKIKFNWETEIPPTSRIYAAFGIYNKYSGNLLHTVEHQLNFTEGSGFNSSDDNWIILEFDGVDNWQIVG